MVTGMGHRVVKLIAALLTSLLVLASLAASPGLAMSSHLALKNGGVLASPGSAAFATVQLGACGTSIAAGTLETNDRPADKVHFTEGGSNGGGCGEGGPTLTGVIETMQLKHTGSMAVRGEFTYTTTLPEECTYKLNKLSGTFTIPGLTQATVSGVAKHVPGNPAGCAAKQSVEGVEATLETAQGGPPFEVSLD